MPPHLSSPAADDVGARQRGWAGVPAALPLPTRLPTLLTTTGLLAAATAACLPTVFLLLLALTLSLAALLICAAAAIIIVVAAAPAGAAAAAATAALARAAARQINAKAAGELVVVGHVPALAAGKWEGNQGQEVGEGKS